MKPIENTFEEEPILALPPVAQRVAYELFSTWPLPKLMDSWINDHPADREMKAHGCPPRFWPEILSAAMVAKVTYFVPNPRFHARHIKYLVHLACAHIGYPLTHYTLAEAIGASQHRYPVLHTWLTTFLNSLRNTEDEKAHNQTTA